MSFVYTEAKRALLAGELDLDANDIRYIYVMTNTTADTQEDVTTIGAFTTLDEFDGSGYTAGVGIALTGEAVAADNTNNRGEFDANDSTVTGAGAGSRNIQGLLLLKFVTNLSSSLPIALIDTGGFPFNGNGGDITAQWNAEGILQAT